MLTLCRDIPFHSGSGGKGGVGGGDLLTMLGLGTGASTEVAPSGVVPEES